MMSDESYDFVGYGPILVGHCPMTDSYLQLCVLASHYWLLRLAQDSICSSPPGNSRTVLEFAREFFLISRKKEIFGAGYPLVWHILE